MAKEASDLTKAIRQLCEESGGTITHGQSRKKLTAMGFEVAPDPGRRSAHAKALEGYDIDYGKRGAQGVIEATLGVDTKTARVVLAEMQMIAARDAERNNFDVTKYNWKKAKDSGKVTTSSKPTSTPNTKPVVAAAAKKNAGPPAKYGPKRSSSKTSPTLAPVVSGDLEALAYVEQAGGLSAVEAQLEAARVEVDRLQAVVDTVQAHVARVTKVAA